MLDSEHDAVLVAWPADISEPEAPAGTVVNFLVLEIKQKIIQMCEEKISYKNLN